MTTPTHQAITRSDERIRWARARYHRRLSRRNIGEEMTQEMEAQERSNKAKAIADSAKAFVREMRAASLRQEELPADGEQTQTREKH